MHDSLCCVKDCDARTFLPDDVAARARKTGEVFYCYRGHRQSFTRPAPAAAKPAAALGVSR